MKVDTKHAKRINDELKAVGFTRMNLRRFTSKYLPKVIHKDEKILAAVSGRRKETEGFFGLVEGMLVATDKRVIFIDHRPGFTDMDEVSYDVVTGVNLSRTLVSSSVTLFTKIHNYVLSYARTSCAEAFVEYVEENVLERKSSR